MNITLYRPTGADELQLIIDSGMKHFPPRLFWQPVFYPVLNAVYAIEIAQGWNMGDPEGNGAGFVTAFEIPEAYFKTFDIQTVGLTHHQELWVPADQLDTFNTNITNGIRVQHAFLGRQFVITEPIRRIIPNISGASL